MRSIYFALFVLTSAVLANQEHQFDAANHLQLSEQDALWFGSTFRKVKNFFGGGKKKPKFTVPPECPVSIQAATKTCQKDRYTDIAKARYWYKITDENSNVDFPLAKEVPWLEQNLTTIKGYYAADPFESRYSALLLTWSKILLEHIAPQLGKAFAKLPFSNNQQYAMAYNGWQGAVKKAKFPWFFGNPGQYPEHTDHINNGLWESDEAFTQRRLTGQCPYLLRKVMTKGSKGYLLKDLKPIINMNFFKNFKIKYDNKKTVSFTQAISDQRLFVLHQPEMVGTKNVPDVFKDKLPDRKLADVKTPITFFVLGYDGLLRVIAIQRNPGKTQKVLVPGDSSWLLAKGEAEMCSDLYCQAKLHLGGVHFVATVYCLSFRRHLSTQHPLYDFFKYHCEGTVPHITTVFDSLTKPNAAGSVIYGTGNALFIKLSKAAFDERNYEHTTFEHFINGNGLDDKRIKYYPYRDDAKEILKEYDIFINSLVDKYYKGGWFSKNKKLRADKELQAWVNELSSNGKKKPDGGKGKMIGFPPSFRSNSQLKTFLKRFLFINLFHTSANYPDTRDFVPISPTRLYQKLDGSDMPFFDALSGRVYAVKYFIFRGLLANFRVNRIFAYWKHIVNPVYRHIVRTSFFRMHVLLQKKLAKRNAARKAKKQLGYQIMEPKWLTNSIHI